MIEYKNLRGNSGVYAYKILSEDKIEVLFQDRLYLYDKETTGAKKVEDAIKLADLGKNLSKAIRPGEWDYVWRKKIRQTNGDVMDWVERDPVTVEGITFMENEDPGDFKKMLESEKYEKGVFLFNDNLDMWKQAKEVRPVAMTWVDSNSPFSLTPPPFHTHTPEKPQISPGGQRKRSYPAVAAEGGRNWGAHRAEFLLS